MKTFFSQGQHVWVRIAWAHNGPGWLPGVYETRLPLNDLFEHEVKTEEGTFRYTDDEVISEETYTAMALSL